jgi:hypothetical protein
MTVGIGMRRLFSRKWRVTARKALAKTSWRNIG